MDINTNVGERIEYIRKQLKISQDKFGNALGITGSAIAHMEKGRRPLTDQMAKAICREYRVDYFWLTEGIGEPFIGVPDTLIDEVVEEYELDDLDRKIIEEYLKLDKDTRAAVKEYLKKLV